MPNECLNSLSIENVKPSQKQTIAVTFVIPEVEENGFRTSCNFLATFFNEPAYETTPVRQDYPEIVAFL